MFLTLGLSGLATVLLMLGLRRFARALAFGLAALPPCSCLGLRRFAAVLLALGLRGFASMLLPLASQLRRRALGPWASPPCRHALWRLTFRCLAPCSAAFSPMEAR